VLQVSIQDVTTGLFMDANPLLRSDPAFSTGEHGMERCDIPLSMSWMDASHYFAVAGSPTVRICGRDLAFSGRVEDIKIDSSGGVTLIGYGLWSVLDDKQDYTALWSTTSFNAWQQLTEENISTVTDTFGADSKDRLYVAPRKGGTLATNERGGHYLSIPDQSSRNMNVIQFEYEIAGGSLWQVLLRRWSGSDFTTPNTIWTPTLTTYGTYTGAICTTFTGSPLLTFELVSQVASTTLGTVIADVDTTLSPTSLRVNTTSGTAVAAPGTVTITPASMTNIVNGLKLLFDAGTTNLEKVTVSNVTGTTFDATFKNAHLLGAVIKSVDDWAVPEVDTTLTAGYAAGVRTITPATMANIVAGMKLIIGFGGEAEEEITVSSVTATTFNATLVYGHASGEKLKNGANSYTVRPQSMTGIVTGMNLTIGGRNSEDVAVTATTGSTFTATFKYGHPGNSTVKRAKLQTVTPAAMTNIGRGREYRIGNEAGVTGSDVERVKIIEATGSTFTAEFDNAHGSTDTVKRIYTGDYDAWLKITNLRVATSTEKFINTSVASSIAAGTRTVTPGSMNYIHVGQQLWIAQNTSESEVVTVTAVTSTTFTAVFAKAHGTNFTVRAIVVHADEIVDHVVGLVSTDNSLLSSATCLIENPSVDLPDKLYEDQSAMDVILDLLSEGDNQTPPRTWSAGIWDDVLHFWPRGTDSKTWYLDANTMELGRSLQSVASAVTAVHKDTNGKLLRTSAATDSYTQEAWAMKRKIVIDVNTTSSAYAEKARDAVLSAKSGFIPAADITFDEIFTDTGALADPWQVHGDDKVIIRNLPAPLQAVDFRICRTDFNGGLRLELEGLADTVESLLAAATKAPAINGARQPFVIGPARSRIFR
jgi:hypothetical protein